MVLVLVEAVTGRQIQYNPSTVNISSNNNNNSNSSNSSSNTTANSNISNSNNSMPIPTTSASIAGLAAYISLYTEIPTDALILLTAKGLMLKDDELLNMAIQDDYGDVFILFIFDRRSLTTTTSSADSNSSFNDPYSSSSVSVISDPPALLDRLPSPPPPSSHTLTSSSSSLMPARIHYYKTLFRIHLKFARTSLKTGQKHAVMCDRLVKELYHQFQALSVALNNLQGYSRSLHDAFTSFAPTAAAALHKHAALLAGFTNDLEALRLIAVHRAIIESSSPTSSSSSITPRRDMVGGNVKGQVCLADYVPASILAVADNCKLAYDQVSAKFSALSNTVATVTRHTDMEASRRPEINMDECQGVLERVHKSLADLEVQVQKIERDFNRIELVFKDHETSSSSSGGGQELDDAKLAAVDHLIGFHTLEYIPDISRSDAHIRDTLHFLALCKQRNTTSIVTRLRAIAEIQSAIAADGVPVLSALQGRGGFQGLNAAFAQLLHVHRMSPAWGATLVEIVRRKEFIKIFLKKSSDMAEVLSRFRLQEEKRRESFKAEIVRYLPLNLVSGLDDIPPGCDVNVVHSVDTLPNITRDDVTDFEKTVARIQSVLMGSGIGGGGGGSHVGNTPADGLVKLQAVMSKMTAQIDTISIEFDRILSKAGISQKLGRLEDENAALKQELGLRTGTHTPLVGSSPTARSSNNRAPLASEATSSNNDGSPSSSARTADETIKTYAARIKTLERILQEKYTNQQQSAPPSNTSFDLSIDQQTQILKERMSESERQFAQKDRDLKAALARIQEMEKMHRDEFESLSMRAEDTELRLAESMGAERTLRKRVSELEDEVMATKMEVKTLKESQMVKDAEINAILSKTATSDTNSGGGDNSYHQHHTQLIKLYLMLGQLAILIRAVGDDRSAADVSDPSTQVTAPSDESLSFSSFLEEVEEMQSNSITDISASVVEDSVATLFSLIQQQKMFYKQRSEEIESRLAKCRSEYEASNERIERLELELVHSYAHKEEQKNTVESLKAHLALVSADSTAALEKERREREVTERHLKDQVSAASAKLADMEKEYAQKSEAHLTAMSSLESRLKDQHSSEISTLESHLSGKYSSDLKARESRLLVLQNEVDDYRNEYTSLKRLLDLAAKEKADHSIHIQNLVDDNKSLRVKMEKADEAASAIRKKLALAATGPPLPPPPDSAAILFQDRLQLRKEQLEDWFLVCRSAFEQATVLQRCMDEVKRKIELFYREALGNAADGGDDGLGDLDSGSEEEDEDEDDEVDVGGDDQVFIFTHQDGTEDEFDSNLREILNDTHERLLKFKSSSAITELSTKITRRLDKLELAYKERCTELAFCEKSLARRISISDFGVNDLVLFLPTKSGKAWAAFNANSPHYFLVDLNRTFANQMRKRDYILARLTRIHPTAIVDDGPDNIIPTSHESSTSSPSFSSTAATTTVSPTIETSAMMYESLNASVLSPTQQSTYTATLDPTVASSTSSALVATSNMYGLPAGTSVFLCQAVKWKKGD